MAGIVSYSGLTAKIMAMRSRLLRKEELREVIEQHDVPAVVNYLRQKQAYADVLGNLEPSRLHRGQVEPLLRETVYRDFNKIYLFANQEQRDFLDMYSMRYEVFFLKECLTRLFDQNHTPVDVSPFEKYFGKRSHLNFESLRTAESIDSFLEILRNTRYYTPLRKVRNLERQELFDYEAALDLFSFSCFWKQKDSITDSVDAEELTEILGTKFELLNIQWICRCKKYYQMTASEIYALLIPLNYHISRSELKAMVEAEDLQAVIPLVRQCYYGRRHMTEADPEQLEASYSAIMKKILRRGSRKNPYSLATIYSYLYTKEHEVDELIIALECVRYQVPAEAAIVHLSTR